MANSEPRSMTRTIPATQMVALLLAFLLAAGAGGVLTAGFVIPAVAGVNAAADSTIEMYDDVPAELEPQPLSQQSRIYASNGKLLATFYYQNRIVVPLEEISEHMQHAAIAIEDERFYEHHGVDPRGVTRAVVNNLGNNATQGASTITQQYVKNMLIEAALQADDPFAVIDAHEDTLNRKLREAKMAIAIEKKMSKDEILQGYLNVAQYGRNQIYGVEAAARYYFDKSASDLNPVEAATIAGVTKAPSRFDPTENPGEAEERRNLVLQNMWKLGYITTEEREDAQETPLEDTLDVTPVSAGCQSAKGSAFFCDYVIKEILLDPTYGETRADRNKLLYRGGLEIHTTLDMKMQRQAHKTIKNNIPPDDASGLEASVVSVEPGTGKIKAMAQNVPYSGTKAAEKTRDTTVNYNADYIHGASGGFQPGSNFKPVVLAQWLREGHTLNETVTANKVGRWPQNFNAPCTNLTSAKPWEPANAEGNTAGNISVLRATYESVNTAYASMGYEINLCDLADNAWDMGFRPTSKTNHGPLTTAKKSDVDVQAPMVLGTQESSPLNMAAMYATLASGGTYCTPVAITEVTGPDGEAYDVPKSKCDKNALPSNIANTVVYAMEQVFSGTGTARALGGLADGRPVAGKTGTSQLAAQTWFSGFTPQLASTVWVGSVDNPHENHATVPVSVNGVTHMPMYGSRVAAPAWKDYMDVAVEGMPVQDFGPPDPNLIGTPPAPYVPPSDDDDDDDSSESSDDGGGDSGGGGDDGGGNGGGNGGGGDNGNRGGNGNGGGNGRGNGDDD